MNEVQAAQRKIASLKKALAAAKNDSDRSLIKRHISIWQDALAKNTAKCCQNCEGRGVLYHGAPDALGTETETCSRCNGKGKVMNA